MRVDSIQSHPRSRPISLSCALLPIFSSPFTDLLFSFPCGKHQSSEAALRLHVDVDRLLLEKEVNELVLSRFDRLCVQTHKRVSPSETTCRHILDD